MWVRKFILVLAAILCAPSAKTQETQVGPNYYVTRVADFGDWTVWKAESRERADCFATLLPEGAKKITHLDVFGAVYAPTLHVVYQLSMFPDGDRNKMWWRLKASQFYNEENGLKEDGDRFFSNPSGAVADLKALDGKRMVAFATSYEERSIRWGFKRDDGVLNFARTIEAIEATDSCRAEAWRCDKSDSFCTRMK